MGNGTHVIQHVLTPLTLTHSWLAIWRGGFAYRIRGLMVYACELWVFAMCCGDPLYHMLETPTFPSTVLSTL